MSAQTRVIERMGLSRSALSGQTVVVTGSGRGIGREAARAFAWLGAKVVVAELSDEGQQTTQEIKNDGGEALFVRTDVARAASIVELADKTHQAYGPVDILVNNAILCPDVLVMDMDPALWDQVIGVNLRGAFLTCRAFLPDMLERGRGTILNMISTDAMPGLSAYIASKKGMLGFSQTLAMEVGQKGVRVIPFGPGMVDTPGMRSLAPTLAPRLGLTPEQFLHMPLHSAYEGLMPAEHAGAATAYLAAVLADEFHGEEVTGYTVLERAGVIAAPEIQPGAPTPTGVAASAIPSTNRDLAAHLAADLVRQLLGVLRDTGAEFSKLPVFFRPFSTNGFKSKAGQSLQDWTRLIDRLARQLEELEAGRIQAAALRPNLSPVVEMLGKLQNYYQEVPRETARVSKDPGFLQEVSRLSAQRVTLIETFISALKAV